jgi:hypothetical protein
MPTSNAAAICFAQFFFAGYYKAADFLQFIPVDLTLLFAAVTVAFCSFEIWRTRSLVHGSASMLAVFLTLAIGLHWPENLSAYAEQKELRLFSLTALSAFAPLLLLRHRDQCRAFVYTICLLGLVMAGIAAIEMVGEGFLSALLSLMPIQFFWLAPAASLVSCFACFTGRGG